MQMRAPRVSLLVPTYNRVRFLGDCLTSLLQQTLPPSQIIVINDGSTDGTPDMLRSFGDRLQTLFTPQVGKSSALNLGLEHVTGDYAWVFDDDDVALPDALERFVEPLEADPSLGFSYSHYWYTPTQEDGSLGTPRRISHIPDVKAKGFLPPLLEANFLGGAALFLRTSCYAKVGGFDPVLIRSQDYEMAIRVARHYQGAQVRGGPTLHYRQHAEPRGSSADRFEEWQRSLKWLEYDQMIFRRLHRELPLEEYLAPGRDRARHRRTALLQRAVVMTSKQLHAEVLADLTEIAQAPDQSPLSSEEKQMVRRGLGVKSWYGGAAARTDTALPALLNSLSRRSPAIHEVRSVIRRRTLTEVAEVSRIILKGREVRRGLVRLTSLAKRISRMSGV